MSAKSRCLLPCPRKGAMCEFPFESGIAVAALAGEDVSMSAKSGFADFLSRMAQPGASQALPSALQAA
eukprot:3094819-Heterocapsa_arctica.AAC.1